MRLRYVEVLQDQTAPTAVGFLPRAITWFAQQGITVNEVLSDNGSACVSFDWSNACATQFPVRHIHTRPLSPRTNGKAEQCIRTRSVNGRTADSGRPVPVAEAGWHLGCANTTPSDRTATSATRRPTQP